MPWITIRCASADGAEIMPLDLQIGDLLTLKKPHACGANAWRVYRLGADLGLRCEQCGRMVLLPRSEVERRLRSRSRDGVIVRAHLLRESKPGDAPPVSADQE